jgi:hypothetical protein
MYKQIQVPANLRESKHNNNIRNTLTIFQILIFEQQLNSLSYLKVQKLKTSASQCSYNECGIKELTNDTLKQGWPTLTNRKAT